MIRKLDSSHAIDQVLATNRLVLLDFYADWCEPCKWLDDILGEVDNHLNAKLLIVKVDTEIFTGLLEKFEVRSVPVLQLYLDNELKWRINGFLNSRELIDHIEAISRGTAV